MTIQPSIFDWIRRYSRTAKRDPREDMLTQAFAGVLNAVDGLPRWLLQELLREPLEVGQGWEAGIGTIQAALDAFPDPPRIKTQVVARVGGRQVGIVDLEIAFGDEALIWVESKHGSNLSNDQLGKYARSLDERRGRKALLLVAPNGFERNQDLPSVAAESSWGHVGSVLKEWIETVPLPIEEEERYDRWIVGQFNDYLREERLLNDHPLEEEDIKTGRRLQSFKRRIDQLLNDVDSRVEHWSESASWKVGEPGRSNQNASWPGRIRTFRSEAVLDNSFGDYWLEWRIRDDPKDEAAAGDWSSTLAAGIRFHRGSVAAANPEQVQDRLDRQIDPRLTIYPDFSGWAWVLDSVNIWEFLDEVRLDSGDDYEAQVKKMSGWITDRFNAAISICSSGEFD